jgi:hypothetical protein
MPFNGTQITEYKDGRDSQTGTLARGSTFNNEFKRLYDNDNYLKSEIESLTGLTENAPVSLNTLTKLAAALGNDPNFAANYNNRIYAASQRNLVYNYDFRYFSNQESNITTWYDYNHPDGWIYGDNGTDGKVGYDTTLKCCKIMTSTDGSGMRIFKQALHEFVNWREVLRGATVTLKAFVKGDALLKLSDGVSVASCVLQNTGAIEEIELQIEVSNLATELTFSIESSTAANAVEVYKVYANRGHEAIETLSCIVQGVIGEIKTYDATEIPPIGEFELNGIELPAGYSRLESVIKSKFGNGANGRSKLNSFVNTKRFMSSWFSIAASSSYTIQLPDGFSAINRDEIKLYVIMRIKTTYSNYAVDDYLYIENDNYNGSTDGSGYGVMLSLSASYRMTLSTANTGVCLIRKQGGVANSMPFANVEVATVAEWSYGNTDNFLKNKNELKTVRWC